MKLVISVCTTGDLKDSLIESLNNIKHESLNIVRGSLLPMARNRSLSEIYSSAPDFTHVLFLDSDISFPKDGVDNLLFQDKDIIGGLAVRRTPPFDPCIHYSQSEEINSHETLFKSIIQKENKTIKVASIGFGGTLIRKKVLDDIRESQDIWFNTDRLPNSEAINEARRNEGSFEDGFKLGITAHLGQPLVGEDVSFCRKARSKGYEVFCHTGVQLIHEGSYGFTIWDWVNFNGRKK